VASIFLKTVALWARFFIESFKIENTPQLSDNS
jgi:hypothetical protein